MADKQNPNSALRRSNFAAYPGGAVTQAESVPSGSGAGISVPEWATEILFSFKATAETDTVTVQPWYYDDALSAWIKMGDAVSFTGSNSIKMYAFGTNVAVQITAITGSGYTRSSKFLDLYV